MATTPRKTVKSNPLDSIAANVKKQPLSGAAKKTASKRVKAEVIETTDQNTSPVVEAAKISAKEPKAKAKPKQPVPVKTSAIASDSAAPAVKIDPVVSVLTKNNPSTKADKPESDKNLTAEALLESEFTPKAAMVMIPADLLDDDPMVDVHALHTVKSWSQWAVLGGLIPTPIVDTVAITGVQIKMIHALCQLYNVEFKKEAALAVVSGLVGGTVTTSLAGMGSLILGHLPVIGSMMKYTAQPALSYASTYALGRVFMRHFENKGTMVDIDSKKLAAYFKEQYARGRKMFKYEFKAQRAQNA